MIEHGESGKEQMVDRLLNLQSGIIPGSPLYS
jgi:hypothetical protein